MIEGCAKGNDNILIRADNGATSFAKSKAEIKRGKLKNTTKAVPRTLEEVFDNPNICIGPTWIHETEKNKYKDELVQYRFIDCSPLCKGNKPCVR